MDLRTLLQGRRAELNLSIRKAAERIGISHTYLAALEKGVDTRGLPTNKPTPETLKLISSGYGLSYDLLMDLCGYISVEGQLAGIDNSDVRTIARACTKMTQEQLKELRRYTEFMFPEAFQDDK